MASHPIIRRSRRVLRWVLWSLGGLLLLVIASFLYVLFVGLSLDASLLRGNVAQAFTNSIGRPVRLDGPMELEVSARPRLRVGGLHISNASGFEGGDFATLGEARLSLDLWPLLLKKELHIEELAGRDVHIRLQSRGEGANNWKFQLPTRPAPSKPPSKSGDAPAISAGEVVTALDVRVISLEKLNVEYVGPAGTTHYFELRGLTAHSPRGQPLTLTLDGTVEKTFPYKLDFTGGRLADLAAGKPWPVELTLTFLSTTLTINGTVSGNRGDIVFGLGTENLAEFERLFQTRLPNVGATGLAGSVSYTPGRVSLKQLSGAMGRTTFIGDLDFDHSGARPKITGSLLLPTMDLEPFIHAQTQSGTPEPKEPPKSLPELYRNLSTATFSLKQLDQADVDVTLGVTEWFSLPGGARDASLRIKLENGKLDAPVKATIAGVTLSGGATADATATPPKFRLVLGTRDSDLGGLAELLVGARGIKGNLGRFELRLAATGDQVSELVRSLDVRLDIDRGHFTYGNVEGSRPVNFGLEKLAIVLPAGKALTGTMRGSLLDYPFLAQLRAGALEPMMLGATSALDFALRSGDVVARIRGTLQAPVGDNGPDLAVGISAPRAGELASWFGFTPGAAAQVSLSGKLSMRTTEWRASDLLFRLGGSSIRADVARVGIGTQPLLKVKLAAEQIDVKELESLLPKSQAKSTDSERTVLDIPILPQGIDLTDADVEVRVKRFAGSPLEVGDVSLDGRIRDGYMYPSPFSASVAATPFTGAVTLDLRGAEPSAGLWLFASDLDVGALLKKLGVGAGLDATFREFGFNLVARSSRLGDMLAKSELVGQFGGGRITLRDRNTGAQARIGLDRGELRADPGAPLRLNLWGSLDDNPVTIELETARADELVNPKLGLPFKFKAEAAQTKVELTGTLARPLGSQIEMALAIQGSRFDALNRIARTALPPWGPWTMQGNFLLSPRGYEVNDMHLQVADSVLTGQGSLVTEGARPRLDVSLSAPNIQLDNFKFGDWSPVARKPAEEQDKPLSADDVRATAAQASKQAQQLLSPEVLRRQDAYLKVQVDQVLSGADKLGGGKLEAKLEDGRAVIGPVEVNIPGGSARLTLGYEPTERDVKVDLRIDVDKFDYGILARRIKPETDLQGTFSLKVAVDSRAKFLGDILKHGNGRIDFAVWPQNMKSGIFDMWAVNLLVALVPVVDPDKASKINCAIGRFQLNDGKLTDRAIVLDTSRMRVNGKGGADFGSEKIQLTMRPQAKKAQFLSLATPIQVSGTFSKFKVGVSPGGTIETIGRLVTSIIWVPLQKLAGKKLPADGSDVCLAPWAVGG